MNVNDLFYAPNDSLPFAAFAVFSITLFLYFFGKKRGKVFWKSAAAFAEFCSIAGLVGLAAFTGKAFYAERYVQVSSDIHAQWELVTKNIIRGRNNYDCINLLKSKESLGFGQGRVDAEFCELTAGLLKYDFGDIDWKKKADEFVDLKKRYKYNDALRLIIEPITDEIHRLLEFKKNLNTMEGDRFFREQRSSYLVILICFAIVVLGVSIKLTRAFVELDTEIIDQAEKKKIKPVPNLMSNLPVKNNETP